MTDTAIDAPDKRTDAKLPEQQRQRCEVWTRVMGYHRPVSSFNIGKQGEHRERKFFRESRTAQSTSDETTSN